MKKGPPSYTGSICQTPNCNFIQGTQPDALGCALQFCRFAMFPEFLNYAGNCPKACGLVGQCGVNFIPPQCPTYCANGGTLFNCQCLCK